MSLEATFTQIQPLVGADGHVYVCTNHRGYKEYSYGSLHEKSFSEIWNDVETRRRVMHQIDNVECFSNCTKLCKPNESNKMVWQISETYNKSDDQEKKQVKEKLLQASEHVKDKLEHPEFI